MKPTVVEREREELGYLSGLAVPREIEREKLAITRNSLTRILPAFQQCTAGIVAGMAPSERGPQTAMATGDASLTLAQSRRERFQFTLTDSMRAYIDSLPEKISLRQEITSYQFWKSLRTELIASFLFVVFTGSMLLVGSEQEESKASNQLVAVMGVGLIQLAVVASLVQSTGHVSGCHLSMAVTVGLFTTERVSPVRLVAYLFVQMLASLAGVSTIYGLFGRTPTLATLPVDVTPAQVFGFEFLATYLVVLTYLANCDQRRKDLGFKSLSIGLAWLAAHLFAYHHSTASISPTRMFSLSLFSHSWCLHWIYWVSPLLSGIIGGVTYEYIGSIKPASQSLTTTTTTTSYPGEDSQQNQSELRHRFTETRAPLVGDPHLAVATATAMLSRSETIPKLSPAISSPSPVLSTIINTSVEDLASPEHGLKTNHESYNMNETRFVSNNAQQRY